MKKIKYEITDDLRLNVWNAEDDTSITAPFYFQNFHLTGRDWESREEVQDYFNQWVIQNNCEVE